MKIFNFFFRRQLQLKVLLLFTFFWFFSSCKGQTSNPKNVDLKTNESSIGDTVTKMGQSVTIIYEAGNGDYWFGSNADGVYKYTGQYLIHYSTSDGLSSNVIREIKEDKKGNIFFSTQDAGVSMFDGKNFTALIPVKSNLPDKGWQLNQDDLWFKGETGKNGPYRYDGKNLYQLEFPKHYLADEYFAKNPAKSWSPYEVYDIYKDKNKNVWFGTSNFGICRFDGKSLSWLYEENLTMIPGGGSFGIRSIIEDRDGKFWFCNTSNRYHIFTGDSTDQNKRLIRYSKEKGIENLNALDGNDFLYFLSATEDDHGAMWMATYDQGVWKYDGKKVTTYPIRNDSGIINVYSVYKDSKGVIWIGTHNGGVYKFNGKSFEKFTI
jgi:ligand-binding sensor domain-containing protein